MKKNIKITLLLSLMLPIMLIISIPSNVFASLTVGSNIGGGVVGSYAACGKGIEICWNYEVYTHYSYSSGEKVQVTIPTQAIRITIVDKSGNRLSGTKSYDFFKGDGSFLGISNKELSEDYLNKTNVNFYMKKYYRNEFRIMPTHSTAWSGGSGKTFKDAGDFAIIYNHVFPNYLKNQGVSLKTFFENVDKDALKEVYLKPLGFNYDVEVEKLRDNPNYFKDIALLIEPLVWFRLTFNRPGAGKFSLDYAGTATEVANMLNSSCSKEPGYTGSDVFFDLIQKSNKINGEYYEAKYRGSHFSSTAFNDTIPLSIYCDTSEIKAGLQGVRHWVESNYSSNYAGELLTSNCVGAGHVWFDELFTLDCDDLEYAKTHVPQCCRELYEIHYLKDRRINIKDYLNETSESCCGPLKNIIPNSLYDEYCRKIVLGCDYKFDVQCPTDCFDENHGYVRDIGKDNNKKDWECIFKSSSSSKPRVKTHYKWTGGGLLGNPYCEVYCREEIDYTFPKGGILVKAGHHFVVGERTSNSWRPIEFNGFQECRTKGNGNKTTINHEQFKKDYEKWDRETVNRWDILQNAIALQNSIDAHTCSSTKNCDRRCVSWSTRTRKNKDGSTSTYEVCTRHEYFGYTCKAPTRYNGVYGPKNAGSWCSTSGTPSAGVPAKRSSFQSARNTRDSFLPLINKCSDWIRNYDTFKPEVFLEYEEEKYGFTFKSFFGSELESDLAINYKTKTFYSGDTYENKVSYKTSLVGRSDCNSTGSRCVKNQQVYPINENRDEQYEKKYVYFLKDNIYRFVTKPIGESMHKKPTGSNDQYIDIQYSNLPIHYSRLPGKYAINLMYTSFGSNNKFNNYIFKGYNFSDYPSGYFKCNNIYECKYEVENEFMYCDGSKCKDIQIIFRPISLINPFPGPFGVGRRIGSNWRFNVNKITQNRNLSLGEKLYSDRDPMYEITLDSVTIGQIKKYNRNAPNGYSDFNLKCVTGEGRECKSDFIRGEFRAKFESKWCGMSADFNKCEKDDNK